MKNKKVSKNREFFNDFVSFNSEKMEKISELKRKLEEFESKHTEQIVSEKVVYSFYSNAY
jgi:low affinity Fe/Cu permease